MSLSSPAVPIASARNPARTAAIQLAVVAAVLTDANTIDMDWMSEYSLR